MHQTYSSDHDAVQGGRRLHKMSMGEKEQELLAAMRVGCCPVTSTFCNLTPTGSELGDCNKHTAFLAAISSVIAICQQTSLCA